MDKKTPSAQLPRHIEMSQLSGYQMFKDGYLNLSTPRHYNFLLGSIEFGKPAPPKDKHRPSLSIGHPSQAKSRNF